ncbi:protein of unknown function (DUF4190) [Promicromonospora umidemergens]|uniref:DUF4190 domain-containing protein n=1 Tax=Promicromonospora umidemergens TaxID=629679 RepID=A0ABP8YEM6_9MICO|nr:DUF4190 domain-containing protein [Promicromonospora umidemergens]MCP2286641.1 protein of unknown function (DUF4190) [Promicromonospora umidemergens]
MTQPDGWQSPYDPPQPYQQGPNVPPPYQEQRPEAPQSPYHQAPYQQQPAPQQPYGPTTPYQPGAQQYPPSMYAAYGYAATPPKNGLGVWSLVLGIVSIVMLFTCLVGFLAAIPALITGYMSRRAHREGLANNGGMALAGIITGWVTVGLTLLLTVLLVALGLSGELD